MDTLEQDRQIIQQIITESAQIPYAHGEIGRHTVLKSDRDRYLLMIVGWEGVRQVHGCIIHLEIIEGKIWIPKRWNRRWNRRRPATSGDSQRTDCFRIQISWS